MFFSHLFLLCFYCVSIWGEIWPFFTDSLRNTVLEDMMWGPGEKIEFFQYILLEHWVGSDLSLLISGEGMTIMEVFLYRGNESCKVGYFKLTTACTFLNAQ